MGCGKSDTISHSVVSPMPLIASFINYSLLLKLSKSVTQFLWKSALFNINLSDVGFNYRIAVTTTTGIVYKLLWL
jgi:hypothetical protein